MGEHRLLIADEPTRGVDVGSKRAIYEVLGQLARAGCAILLISSEVEEVIKMSHRILVMRQGRVVAEFGGDNTTAADILTAAFGADADHPSPGRDSRHRTASESAASPGGEPR